MNNSFRILLTALCLASLLLSGCLSTVSPTASRSVSQREDFLILQEENRRLAGQMDTLSLRLDRVEQRLDRLAEQQAQTPRTVEMAMDSVRTRVDALEAARTRDREEIVETLSRKISDVLASSSGSSTASSGYGYEHEVQAGETLSEIARAYGGSMKAIIRANDLRNPNALRVGQKLFIPE